MSNILDVNVNALLSEEEKEDLKEKLQEEKNNIDLDYDQVSMTIVDDTILLSNGLDLFPITIITKDQLLLNLLI